MLFRSNALISSAKTAVSTVYEKMSEYRVADALDAVWSLLRRSNKYIDETTPWILGKDESQKDRLGTVMYNLVESIRISAVLLSPFMPDTANKILKQLNIFENKDLISSASIESFGNYPKNTSISSFEPLYMRLDEKVVMDEINKHFESLA